jgi:hypothetical protein
MANDLIPVMATVVVAATLATLILGLLSYVAFLSRERRRPRVASGEEGPGKQFFVRYTLPDGGGDQSPGPRASRGAPPA